MEFDKYADNYDAGFMGKGSGRFYADLIKEIEVKDGDVVMACMAYHHFPDQERFRSEAMRVLKPGGSLYISDPRFPLIVRWIFNTFFKDAGFHTTKKNKMDFEHSGFKTVSVTKDIYVQVLHFTKGE